MTEYCSFCGVYSRDSCSYYYKGRALREELLRCGNLCDGNRMGALCSAGIATDTDWEVGRLREENVRLRSKLSKQEGR